VSDQAVTQVIRGKIQSVEWTGVKVRAVPDENGRTFEDPEWIPTHVPIQDLGVLCFQDYRPWYVRARDALLGKLRPNVGHVALDRNLKPAPRAA